MLEQDEKEGGKRICVALPGATDRSWLRRQRPGEPALKCGRQGRVVHSRSIRGLPASQVASLCGQATPAEGGSNNRCDKPVPRSEIRKSSPWTYLRRTPPWGPRGVGSRSDSDGPGQRAGL